MKTVCVPEQEELHFDDVGWGLGWAFLIQWVIANAVSWNLSMMVRQVLVEAGAFNRQQVVMGIAIGLTLGLGQWLILLQYPVQTGWRWILVSTAGWSVGWAGGWQIGWQIFGSMGFGAVFAVVGACGGALAGVGQWFILREQVYRAAWWIPVNALGFAVGLAITFTVGREFGWLITGGVAGTITGLFLSRLLRRLKD